jgi:hypothetical protein
MARFLLTGLQYNRMMKAEQITQMKARCKRTPLTFGDFVTGVYQIWGNRKAKGIVQLAVEVHLIKFRGTERFVFY